MGLCVWMWVFDEIGKVFLGKEVVSFLIGQRGNFFRGGIREVNIVENILGSMQSYLEFLVMEVMCYLEYFLCFFDRVQIWVVVVQGMWCGL